MVLIRHTNTDVELDVPEEAVPYFPDYELVEAPAEDKSPRGRKPAEPTTTEE